jgi:alpha-beta hydrolase superfamily lysophospholipase
MHEERLEIIRGQGRKEPIYFGVPGRPLFGFHHSPLEEGRRRQVGVLLCPPIGTDHVRSEWIYRNLAERLAALGFPCLRFDLSGTGDSSVEDPGGDPVRTWLEDIDAAAKELRARSGAPRIALFGIRLGATLALAYASSRADVDSLVLWSPCVSGTAFLEELRRLHTVYTRIEPHVGKAPPPRDGSGEALGLRLPPRLVGSLSRVDTLELTGRPAARALVVDGGGVAGLDRLCDRLRSQGTETAVEPHPGHKFLVTVSHRQVLPEQPIASVARWLDRAHPEVGCARAQPSAPVAGPAGERALVFGSRHRLFGILTPAAGASRGDSRPAIVIANAGCVNRQGPHAMFVQAARQWASRGYDVLRLDLSGIGDSPAAQDVKENLTYPPSGFDDLTDAIRATGRTRAIIAGLCSGGDYAFQLGLRGAGGAAEVVGAWIMNPRTFGALDLTAVESGTPPANPVAEVPRALRSMAERGVDTLLIVSQGDPGVAYVDAHAGEEMKALSRVDGFSRVDLEDADHPFSPVSVQERVTDLLTARLATDRRVKVTPVKFSNDELALLEVIQGQTGVKSRTEALRAVLEFYVKEKGLESPAPHAGESAGTADDPERKP